MNPVNVLQAATLALTCMLSGCVSNQDAEQSDAAVDEPFRQFQVVPVYVVPNCKTYAGEQHCQWIEPRGYHKSSQASDERVQGTAI